MIYNWKPYFTLKDSVMDPSYDGPDMTCAALRARCAAAAALLPRSRCAGCSMAGFERRGALPSRHPLTALTSTALPSLSLSFPAAAISLTGPMMRRLRTGCRRRTARPQPPAALAPSRSSATWRPASRRASPRCRWRMRERPVRAPARRLPRLRAAFGGTAAAAACECALHVKPVPLLAGGRRCSEWLAGPPLPCQPRSRPSPIRTPSAPLRSLLHSSLACFSHEMLYPLPPGHHLHLCAMRLRHAPLPPHRPISCHLSSITLVGTANM